MTRRDKDLKKLKSYIKTNGFIISIHDIIDESPDIAGDIGVEEKHIRLATKGRAKITQILTLLHEYGHYLDFINRGWMEDEYIAMERFYEEGCESPQWVKKSIWNLEERAHNYILPLAKELDIKIPKFLFNFDIEKTRKLLRLEFKYDRISRELWIKEKRKIRNKLRGLNAREKPFKKAVFK